MTVLMYLAQSTAMALTFSLAGMVSRVLWDVRKER